MSKFGLNLAQESWDAEYSQVWEGVYTINESLHPFGLRNVGSLNNRCFVYQVETPELGTHFLMSGILGHNSIKHMKKLEEDKGIPLKMVVTSGDYHHLAMRFWMEAFPEATFIQSSIKFPHTKNGKDILADEELRGRISLTEGDSFPMLEPYKDVVQFYGFNQCFVLDEFPYYPKDSKSSVRLGPIRYIDFTLAQPNSRCLSIWHFHVPSKTMVFEHNFATFVHKQSYEKDLTAFGRFLLKPENLASIGDGANARLPRTKEACQKHCQQFETVLKLDARALMDYHSACALLVREWDSQQAYQEEMTKLLQKTGENDPNGDALFQYMNQKKGCSCC